MTDAMIIIMSGQPDPNLLPILDKKYKVKNLYIVASRGMKNKVKPFCDALRGDINTTCKDNVIDIADENCINESFTKISECLNKLTGENKSVVVNFTGGTKPMSIGAFMAWRSYSDRAKAIYVDIVSGNILEYTGMDGDVPVVEQRKNECVLDFKKYFMARDIKFEDGDEKLIEDEKLASVFIRNMLSLDPKRLGYVSCVNILAVSFLEHKKNQGKKKKKENTGLTNLHDDVCDDLLDLLSEFEDESLITLKEEQCNGKRSIKIESADVRAVEFLGGKWLENYCFDVVTRVVPKNMAQKSGLIYHKDGSQNELDILFFHKGTLYVIEVKTIIWKDDDNKQQNFVHKLKSLGENLGLKTKLCIVSYYDVNDKIRRRAEGQKIRIIEGKSVRNESMFKHEIERWIGI